MHVSHENIESAFPLFEKLNSSLVSGQSGNFSLDNITSISNVVKGIDLTNWKDKISTKVNDKVTYLKDEVVYSIEKSIQEEYNCMVTISGALIGAANTYKSDKEVLEKAKENLSSTQSENNRIRNDEDKDNDNQVVDTNSLEEAVKNAEEKLDKDLDVINAYLAELDGISFNPRVGSDGDSNNNETPKDTTPDTEAPKEEDVISKIDANTRWQKQTTFSRSTAKESVYRTTIDGIDVYACCRKDNTVLYYWYEDSSGNLQYYDHNGNPITQEQALESLYDYNGWEYDFKKDDNKKGESKTDEQKKETKTAEVTVDEIRDTFLNMEKNEKIPVTYIDDGVEHGYVEKNSEGELILHTAEGGTINMGKDHKDPYDLWNVVPDVDGQTPTVKK